MIFVSLSRIFIELQGIFRDILIFCLASFFVYLIQSNVTFVSENLSIVKINSAIRSNISGEYEH